MSDTATSTDGEQQQTDGEQQQTETPTVESLQEALDKITAESRKWEDRAKGNFDAKKELDALKASQMTDAEKAQAASEEVVKRAEDAEQRATSAESELARYKIAVEFDLSKEDAEALASVTDEATLRSLAERLAGRPGPRPDSSQGRGNGAAPTTPAEAFADAVGELF